MSADEHLRLWLAEGMTGCQFAKLIAQRRERIVTSTFAGLTKEEDVSRTFEAGTAARLPAIAIFTGIRTEEQLVEQLRILSRGTRWRITSERPDGLETDDVMVGMTWQVREGLVSSPMGLAPFGTMPVTRRAPYVCIAAWPGGHDNPRWKRFEEGVVHFLDTDISALNLSKAKYTSLTEVSNAATEDLLSETGDGARFYRRTAFRLRAAVAAARRPPSPFCEKDRDRFVPATDTHSMQQRVRNDDTTKRFTEILASSERRCRWPARALMIGKQ